MVRPHNGFEVRLARFYVEFAGVLVGSLRSDFWLPYGENRPACPSHEFTQGRQRLPSFVGIVVKIVVKIPAQILPMLPPMAWSVIGSLGSASYLRTDYVRRELNSGIASVFARSGYGI